MNAIERIFGCTEEDGVWYYKNTKNVIYTITESIEKEHIVYTISLDGKRVKELNYWWQVLDATIDL